MRPAPFHLPLPPDDVTSTRWSLTTPQAAQEHAAWLRLRGFVDALLKTWPKNKTWVVLTLGSSATDAFPLALNHIVFGDSNVSSAPDEVARRWRLGRPGPRPKNAVLDPSVVAWLGPSEEFSNQFKQLFYSEHQDFLGLTPDMLRAFLALPLEEWSQDPATHAGIAQCALGAALEPGPPTPRRRRV